MSVELPGIRAVAELSLDSFKAQQAVFEAALAKMGQDIQRLPPARVAVNATAVTQQAQSAVQTVTRQAELAEQARVVAQERADARIATAHQRALERQNALDIAASKKAQAEFEKTLDTSVPPITPHLDDKALRTEVAGLRGFISQAFRGFGGLTSVPGLGFLTTAPALVGAASLGAALGLLGKTAVDMGLAFQTAFRQIAVGTGATGAELAALQGSFRTVAASGKGSLDDIATAITQLSIRTDATGPALEAMTRNILKFSALAGGEVKGNTADLARLFNNWNIATEAQAGTLDKFVVILQKTGEAPQELIEALSRFGPLFRQFGLGLDESIAFLSRLEEEGVPARETIAGLRQSLDNFLAVGKTPAQGLRDTLTAIRTLGSDSEATAVAIQNFGPRAGAAIAELARSGKLNTDDLVASLRNAAGATDAATTASQTTAKQAGQAFEALKRSLDPVGEGIIALGGLLAVNLTGAIKDVKAESEGMGAGVTDFIARVQAAIADLDKLRTQALIPLPVPTAPTEGGGTGLALPTGTPEGFLLDRLGLRGAGQKLADQTIDEYVQEIQRRGSDPSLGSDAFQRLVLGIIAPERLKEALAGKAEPAFTQFVDLAERAGAESANAFATGFARTDLRDETNALLSSLTGEVNASLGRLHAQGIEAGAFLLQGFENGVQGQSPELFAQLATLKEQIAGSLARGRTDPGLEAGFRAQIAAMFGAISPDVVDQMWAQITGRSKALAQQGGAEAGKAHTDAIVETTKAEASRAAVGVAQSLNAIFAARTTIDIPSELISKSSTQDQIALLLRYQSALSETQSAIGQLTNKQAAAHAQQLLNNGDLEGAQRLTQQAAAAQQVLSGRYDQLASASLPGLNAQQAILVDSLQKAHDPAAAASAALTFLGASADEARAAVAGTGAQFADFVTHLKRLADTADPVAAGQKAIEASAQSMLQTLSAGLPAANRAWVQYTAAREGDRDTLRALYQRMGGDLEAFDQATEAQQQRLIARMATARQAAEVFHSTGRLLPAQDEPDLLGRQAQEQAADRARSRARQDEDLARAAARRAADATLAASRLTADRRTEDSTTASAGRAADADFQQRAADIRSTLDTALAQVDHSRGTLFAEFARTIAREQEDFQRTWERQQRDFAQQDAESLRSFREQAGDLLVGATGANHAAAADAVQGLIGLNGDALRSAAAGVVDQFQGQNKQMQEGLEAERRAWEDWSRTVRASLQQVSQQAAESIKSIREALLQAGAFGNTPAVFGQAGTVAVTSSAATTQAQSDQRSAAILAANLKIADQASKQQEILTTGQRARDTHDRVADAAGVTLQRALYDIGHQAADQRDAMIEQLSRMVEGLGRSAFQTRQGREDQRSDTGNQQARQAEDQARALEQQITALNRQQADAVSQASQQAEALRREREQQARAQEEQARRQAEQRSRQDADLARELRRAAEDAALAAARLQEDRALEDRRRAEEIARAREQVRQGDALDRIANHLEGRTVGVEQNFDLRESVFVEPATELLEIAARRLEERVAARTAG